MTLLLIIAVVVLIIKNDKLSNTVKKYEKILRDNNLLLDNNQEVININEQIVNNNQVTNVQNIEHVNNQVIESRVTVPEKPKYSDKEIKNSSILIVGSILVVLSALIFLMSTWDVTNNIFKTILMLVMLCVFLGASYIAKKINLKQTEKAFHYIALAYIPITLLSIWLFKLFGIYLSYEGEGSYLYLCISSLIVTLIYYLDSKQKNNTFIGACSVVFLNLAFIFLSIKIYNTFSFVLLFLSLLNIIFTILYQSNKYYLNEKINKNSILTMTIYIGFLTLFTNLFKVIGGNIQFVNILLDFAVLYSIYFASKITDKTIFDKIYTLCIVFIGLNITAFFDDLQIKQVILLFTFIGISLFDLTKNNKLSEHTYYELMGSNILLFVITRFSDDSIPTYFMLIVLSIITAIFYFTNERKEYSAYFLSISGLAVIIDFLITYELSVLYIGYIAAIMLFLRKYINKKSYILDSFKILGYIIMFAITLFLDESNIFTSILLFGVTYVSFMSTLEKKDIFTRMVSYIYLNISLFMFTSFLGIDKMKDLILIIPFTSIVIFFLEYFINELNDDENHLYMLFHFAISAIILACLNNSFIHILFIIIINVLFYIYINKNNMEKNLLYASYVSFIPFIYFSNIELVSDYMFMISYLVFALLLYYTYYKKENRSLIIYFVYLLFHASVFDDSKYVILFIFSLMSIVGYLIKEDKLKDVFKTFLYTCILLLIRFITYDLELDTISLLHYGPYFVWIICITRNIVKKYSNDYKVFEYISLVLINIIAISGFTDEMDGLVFVLLLTILVIIGYVLKYGPVFLISLIFILVNILLLTREFWLSLPWWLYILLIGAILISFAVYNELKDKNNNDNKIKLTTKIKNDLDL